MGKKPRLISKELKVPLVQWHFPPQPLELITPDNNDDVFDQVIEVTEIPNESLRFTGSR